MQKVGIARQLCRLSKMADTRLNRRVYKWSLDKPCGNAAHVHKTMFNDVQMPYIYDLSLTKSKSDVVALKERLLEMFVNGWYVDLNRLVAKRGTGKNKLRTYRRFKFVYGTEEYLLNRSITPMERRAMAKIRCSATSLLI